MFEEMRELTWSGPFSLQGRCVSNKCADEVPFPLGTRCSEHSQCAPGVQCAAGAFGPRTWGGAPPWCTVPAGTVGGPSDQCSGKQPGQAGQTEGIDVSCRGRTGWVREALILTCFCDAAPGYCMDGGANGYCTDSTNTVGS